MASTLHKKILTVAVCLSVLSCGNGGSNDDVLARVGSDYLYRSDLDGLIPNGLTAQDSIQRSKTYVDSWINHHILLQKASGEIKSSMKEIDRQVENYKHDLVLAEYEQQYLSKKLDTVVTPKQIEEFYTSNAQMFELRDYVVNVFYLKFAADEKDIDKIGYELRRCPDPKTAALLDKKYAPMASNSFYDPENWLFLNDLLREIPLEIEDKTRFLENNPYVEVKTDEFVYLVRIFEYKLKNDTSPLNLVSSKIKTLILRKRAKDLLANMHSEIIKKYRSENDVENFTK